MSSVASVEFAHSPEELAGIIDREFADIAGHLPEGVMTSQRGAGFAHEIHRVSELGVLRAMYLGCLVGEHKLGPLFNHNRPHDRYAGIRLIALGDDETTGFYQDFVLDYWKKPTVISPTTAEDIADAQTRFPELSMVVQSLHQTYMKRVLQPEVVSLAEHARNRNS